MKQCSVIAFVKEIEEQMPKFFNCERATVVLVHRAQKCLYRIVPDQEAGGDKIITYNISCGYSGIAALSGKMLHTQDANNDINFVREVDDAYFDAKSQT